MSGHNADLRNIEKGGWFYAEHELFDVFAPLIGPDGVAVYMAMCRLIPLAAARPEFPVTVLRAAEQSCVSRSQTARKIREICALGMVVEYKHSRQRPSTYQLASLRDLALVGEEELQRRIGVPPGDTGKANAGAEADAELLLQPSHRAANRVQEEKTPANRAESPIEPPSAGVDFGVPPGDTETGYAGVVEKASSDSVSGTPVSQKRGLVSQNRSSVSQGKTPLLEEEKEERKKDPPYPPPAGGAGSPPGEGDGELPFAGDARQADPEFKTALDGAAQWVMRELGLTGRRLEECVATALWAACRSQRDQSLGELARAAVANWRQYLEDQDVMRFGPWRPMTFFGDGHWISPKSWPYDQAKLEAWRAANIGRR